MVSENNAVIGFPRWTAESTFAAGGGSWNASYPVTNLSGLPLQRVARSTNALAASTKFRVTLPEVLPVRLLAFVNHNATLDATYRIRVYRDLAASDLAYDSGASQEFFPPVYNTDNLEWEDPRWWNGRYTTRELAGYRPIRPVWLPQTYAAGSIQVDVVDTGNPAGFFQCGLFEVSQGSQVEINFRYSAEFGFSDRAQMVEAEGGARYFNERGNPRIFNGSINYLDIDDVKTLFFEQLRQCGASTPFLWLPNPNDELHLLRDCFLARNAALNPLSHAFFQRGSVPLNFIEVR